MKKLFGAFALSLLLATPQTRAFDFKPSYIAPLYSAYLLFACYNKESKANPEFKGSLKRIRSMNLTDANWWKNFYELHDEWMVGQRGKDRLLKTTKDGEIKVSSKKCSAHGFAGKMLEHFSTIDKTRKAMIDVAFAYFVIHMITKGEAYTFIKKVLNWNDPFEDKEKPNNELEPLVKEIANLVAQNQQLIASINRNNSSNPSSSADFREL